MKHILPKSKLVFVNLVILLIILGGSRRSQPPLARSVPLSQFTPQFAGGSTPASGDFRQGRICQNNQPMLGKTA
jgi:hypothetical protein